MKSFIRVCLILLLICLFYVVGERFHHFLTDGFTLARAKSDQFYLDGSDMTAPSPQELDKIHHIFDQEFTYLGKGTQSFAFESRDKAYVLKLYKHHRHRRGLWMQPFCLPPFDEFWHLKRLEQTRHFQETFYSFKLAFDVLKQETGLIFMHLGKTQFLNQKVAIIDKMERRHWIDLDQMEFSLQLRAQLIKPLIEELMNRGDIERAKEILTGVVDLLKKRCEKGIGDRDPGITYNLGFTKEGAIFIDLGQFYLAPELKDKTRAREKIYDVTGTLRDWLKIHYPELEMHVLTEVRK